MKITIILILLLAFNPFQKSMEKINLHLDDAPQELKDSEIIYGFMLNEIDSEFINILTSAGIIWKYSANRRVEKYNMVTFEDADLAWRREFKIKEDCIPIIQDILQSAPHINGDSDHPKSECIKFFWNQNDEWVIRYNCNEPITPENYALYNKVEGLISENLIFQGVPTTQE